MTHPIIDHEFSVVIPTVGRPILQDCLDAVARGTVRPAEVIIVDQSASAAAAWVEAAKSAGLSAFYMQSAQRGKAAGLNRGLERVHTRYVAITDDDCLVDRRWLEEMASHVRLNPRAVVTGPAHAARDSVPVSTVSVAEPSITRRPQLQFDLFCGSNMGASLETIRGVGGFDEHPSLYAAAEDCEWAYRVLRAQIPIVYRPEVVVRHVGWRTTEERYGRYHLYARSHGSFYGKYLRRGDCLIAGRVVIHHVRALKRWIKGALTDNRDLMLNGRAYLTGLLPGIVEGLRRGRTS